MKNIFGSLFLVLLIVTLYSCSSDDGPSVDPDLFDTWTLNTTVFRDCGDPDLDDTINELCNDISCQKMVLNSDYTYQMIFTSRGVDEILSGTFEVIGNEIQLVSSSNTAEIVEFSVTSTSLVFTTDVFTCTKNLIYIK